MHFILYRYCCKGRYHKNIDLKCHSIKRRHQSPEWMILSHVIYFIQEDVIGFQVLSDSLHPHSMRASWWSPPVLQREAVKVLASASSGICSVRPNREKRCACTIAERCGCLVFRLTSSFRPCWNHLIPDTFCRHRCFLLCAYNMGGGGNLRLSSAVPPPFDLKLFFVNL